MTTPAPPPARPGAPAAALPPGTEEVHVDGQRLERVRRRNERRRFDAEVEARDLVETALEEARAEVKALRQAVSDLETELAAKQERIDALTAPPGGGDGIPPGPSAETPGAT